MRLDQQRRALDGGPAGIAEAHQFGGFVEALSGRVVHGRAQQPVREVVAHLGQEGVAAADHEGHQRKDRFGSGGLVLAADGSALGVAIAGLVALGLFSSLFVATFLRDVLLVERRWHEPLLGHDDLRLGARSAFETIVEAYSTGDKDVQIDYRPVHAHTLTNEVESIPPKKRVYRVGTV